MRGLHMCELEGGEDMRGHCWSCHSLSLLVWRVAVLGDLLSFSKKKKNIVCYKSKLNKTKSHHKNKNHESKLISLIKYFLPFNQSITI